jgi:hypothetical protein
MPKTNLALRRASVKQVRECISKHGYDYAAGYADCLLNIVFAIDPDKARDYYGVNFNNVEELVPHIKEVLREKDQLFWAFEDSFEKLEQDKKKRLVQTKKYPLK